MTSSTVYRKLSHKLLFSPFFCPFFSLSNLSGMASDGYRWGYVSFAHFLLYFLLFPCVCVCVNFFFVKDFSGTTVPRILKIGTNIG